MGVPGIGRRQKTAALRALQGSRKRPHQHAQPQPAAGRPTCPRYLSAGARAMWEELADLLERERRLSLSEANWLTAAAEAWEDYQRWRVAAEQTPLTQEKVTVDGSGQEQREVKTHPTHQQVRLARRAWTDLLKEAGLTPASRGRVVMPAVEEDADPTEVFLRRVQ